MRPVIKRYAALERLVIKLTIYGEADVSLPLYATQLVALEPTSPLACEWFLVVRSARHQAVIVAQDLDGFSTEPLSTRRFRAIASHSPELVDCAAGLLAT